MEGEVSMNLGESSNSLTAVTQFHMTPAERRSLNAKLPKVPARAIHRALRRLQRKEDCKKLLLHVCFLILYTAVVINTLKVSETYFQISAIENIILSEEVQFEDNSGPFFAKTFHTIGSFEDYFDWVNGPLLSGVFIDSLYNEQDTPADSQLMLPEGLSSNRIVGAIRFRTIRVTKNDPSYCAPESSQDILPSHLNRNGTSDCFPAFRPHLQAREPFNGFQFQTGMSRIRGMDGYGGDPQVGYGDDGHVFYLNTMKEVDGVRIPLNKSEAEAIIQEQLIGRMWADKATRALVVEFNLLSFNLGNMLTCRMVAEVLPGGSWYLYWRMYPVILSPLRPGEGWRVFAQVLLLIWSVLILLVHIVVLWRRKWAVLHVFLSVWRIAKLMNDILAVVVVSLLIYMEHNRFNDAFTQKITNTGDGEFAEVFEDARYMAYTGYLACVNLVFAFLKVFNYLRNVTRMMIIWKSLEKALPELFALMFAFIIMNTAFVLIGHILFGYRVQAFHTIFQSYSTLFRSIVGDFDYLAISEAEPNFAGFYYCLVLFFQFFTLLNMFIAVVTETYSATKDDSDRERRKKAPIIIVTSTEDKLDRFVLSTMGWYFASGSAGLIDNLCIECTRRVKSCFNWQNSKTLASSGGESAPELESPLPVEDKTPLRSVTDTNRGQVKFMNTTFRMLRGSQKYDGTTNRISSGLRDVFESCPSNWVDFEWSPNALFQERQKWITTKQLPKVSPYRKMWWYACKWVCVQIRQAKRQAQQKSTRHSVRAFISDVNQTRTFLAEHYGTETIFSRHWTNVANANRFRLRLRMMELKVRNNGKRLAVYKILQRAKTRHMKDNSSLIETFTRAWDRLGEIERSIELNFEDVLRVVGFHDGKTEGDDVAYSDAMTLLQVCHELSVRENPYRFLADDDDDSISPSENISNLEIREDIVALTEKVDFLSKSMTEIVNTVSASALKGRDDELSSSTAQAAPSEFFTLTFAYCSLGMEIAWSSKKFIVSALSGEQSFAAQHGVKIGDRIILVDNKICDEKLTLAELTTLVSEVKTRPVVMLFQRTDCVQVEEDDLKISPNSTPADESLDLSLA